MKSSEAFRNNFYLDLGLRVSRIISVAGSSIDYLMLRPLGAEPCLKEDGRCDVEYEQR